MEPDSCDPIKRRRASARAADGRFAEAATFPSRERAELRSSDSSRSLPSGRPGLVELIARWNSLAGALPENVIRSGLEQLSLERDALEGCAHFNERTYQRNLVHHTANYEVLILCWRSGQRSPIHDHGESACGVLVIEGVATETSFLVDSIGKMMVSRSAASRLAPSSSRGAATFIGSRTWKIREST